MTNTQFLLEVIDTMRKKETFWCCTGQCEYDKKTMLDTIDKLVSHLSLLQSQLKAMLEQLENHMEAYDILMVERDMYRRALERIALLFNPDSKPTHVAYNIARTALEANEKGDDR